MHQCLGTTILIENRSGASGSVGTAAVVESPPDGNTWLAVFDNHAANPFVLPSPAYDSDKDLDPVLLIGTAPYMITTAKAKPYNTLADVIAFARGNPGKVSYGSVGSGSVGHLAMALLSQRAGMKLTHVPYRGECQRRRGEPGARRCIPAAECNADIVHGTHGEHRRKAGAN
jgi:tripartite-type tricarboxylate transporter receptor subunit TctC